MARIPKEELDRLKREADLVALVRAAGVELAQCGADFVGLCPFHEEKSPSFHVTPHGPDGWPLYHCFGCHAGGDVFRFVELIQHVSFRHSVEIVRGAKGAAVGPIALPRGKRATPLSASLPLSPELSDQALLSAVVDFYHRTFLESPDAQAYVRERGLASAEMVERFHLGYANRTLAYRLPKITWKEGQEVRARLARLGILRETGHEHLAGSVVLPIFGEGDAASGGRSVLGLYGRKITSGLREGTPLHLYLPGPHKGVWNVEALTCSKEIILCEGPWDMLSFWCCGYKNVTASYGTDGFTPDHLAAFERHGIQKVLIAYDRDDAGDKAAAELSQVLAEVGIDSDRVLVPQGMDPNDYARSVESPVEALGAILRSAQFMAKGKRGAPRSSTAAAPPSVDPSPQPAEPPSPVEGARGALWAGPGAATAPTEADSPATSRGEEPEAPRATEPPPAPAAAPAEPPAPGVEDLAAGVAPAAPSETPSVSPLASRSAGPSSLTVNGDAAELVVGDRSYRVGNLAKNLSPNAMRVTLRVSRGEKVHVDALELLSDRARQLYIKRAAEELGVEPEVVKKDLGKLLFELEGLQQRRIDQVLEAKPKNVEIPEEEKAEAFALLRNPRLIELIIVAFDRIGLVGERTNKLVGYLAAISRKLTSPLAILIQSNSAAGKSALMDAILLLVPSEDVEKFTALTAQSLFYMGELNLKHRILAIAEVAGADRAGYPIKMLQSEGRISIATTVKDPTTGDMTMKKHEVEGPTAIFLTTTEAEIDEELQNRALVLTVNEDREQTRAIHEAQRHAETLDGILAAEEREATIRLHQNAQRLLRPLRVVNPFAKELTFGSTKLRTRRDHVKYLTLIRAVALLHQYQRPIKQETRNGRVVPYIEVTRQDIATAHRLANDVFGRSLDDLSPATRRLLTLLDQMATVRCEKQGIDRQDLRFTRREVREYTKWGHSQLCVHLDRLVEMEYLVIHHGAPGQRFVYELAYSGEGKDGGRFVVGLMDPKDLKSGYDANLPGGEGDLPGRFRPASGPLPGTFRGAGNGSG